MELQVCGVLGQGQSSLYCVLWAIKLYDYAALVCGLKLDQALSVV